ncbi:Lar family restriction alleviation protein [Acetobacter sp.]|uniref:Lar family restriction alleviation protein n=1 Tax=Acetobacter sp. TaxID=440 RepID=UPI0039E87C9A
MSEELKSCPECNGNLFLPCWRRPFQIKCGRCFLTGPKAATRDAAIIAWNTRTGGGNG